MLITSLYPACSPIFPAFLDNASLMSHQLVKISPIEGQVESLLNRELRIRMPTCLMRVVQTNGGVRLFNVDADVLFIEERGCQVAIGGVQINSTIPLKF